MQWHLAVVRASVAHWAASVGRLLILVACFGAHGVTVGATAEVERGTTWLQGQVLANGTLQAQASAGAQQLAQCEVARTLARLAPGHPAVGNLIGALATDPSARLTESLACAVEVGRRSGASNLPALTQRQRSDAVAVPYAGLAGAGVADTSAVFDARMPDLDAEEKARTLSWLAGVQAASGAFRVAGRDDVVATAAVVRALRAEAPRSESAAAIAQRGAAWLLGQRAADGTWANRDIALTALTYEAVHPYSGTATDLAGQIRVFLHSTQAAEGSWLQDAFTTAVALRALALTYDTPLSPTSAAIRLKFIDARNGLPVAGVRVTSQPPGVDVVSDAGGIALATGLAPGSWSLTASGSGFAGVTLVVLAQPGVVLDVGSVQLVMPLGTDVASLSGTVRETATGAPIAGAQVAVEGQPGAVALTAADGNYLLPSVMPGTLTVRVSKAGYFSAASAVQAQAGRVTVYSPTLARDPSSAPPDTCRIAGTVTAGTSRLPLAGVTVSVVGGTATLPASVTTDAAGNYALTGLVSDTVIVTASLQGYRTVEGAARLFCSAVQPTSLEFSPRLYLLGETPPPDANASTLTGRVMSAATSQPIAGATLALTGVGGQSRSGSSAGDGSFSFPGLSGAAVQLSVTAAGHDAVTLQFALNPLEDNDAGQIRLRPSQATQLLPDLKVLSVRKAGLATDPQTLAMSGAVQVQVANVGTASAPTGVGVLAFIDQDRDAVYGAADLTVGQAVLPAALAPGQTTTLQITVAGTAPFRDAPVHAIVDPQAQAQDANRANNVRATSDEAIVVPVRQAFAPVLKYKWTAGQVMMSPVVGPLHDTNGDGRIDSRDTPRIVFTSYAGGYQAPSTVRAIDGATGAELFAVPPAVFGGVGSQTGLVLADLDGDGVPEIVGARQGNGTTIKEGVVVLDNQGRVKWQADAVGVLAPSVADIDGDGSPEVLAGEKVFSGTGTLKFTLAGCRGSSYAVRVLPASTTQQIVCGSSLYDSVGTLIWGGPFPNTAVYWPMPAGNFNADPNPEFVLVHSGNIRLVNHQGQVIWGPVSLGGGWGGAPLIADVDGDGVPEIGVAAGTYYTLFNADGSVRWRVRIADGSANTGSTAFDFDGDGKAEIIYRDEQYLYVFDGPTGAVLFSTASRSLTGAEYPVVADVDGDGRADLVVPGDGGAQNGIWVYRDVQNAWVSTRRIWNQYDYSITNINDDASVPRQPAPAWQTHNTFRLNRRVDGDPRAVADLTAGFARVSDGGAAGSVMTVRVGNAGGLFVPAGAKLAMYSADPGSGQPPATALLAQVTVVTEIPAGGWVDVALPVNRSLATLNALGRIWVVADDDGTGARAIADFDRANNTLAADLPALAANVRADASTDKPAYTDADLATLRVTATNLGSFGQVAAARFSLLDARGTVVETLPLTAAASVPPAGTATFQSVWPVAGVMAGAYTVRAELVATSGLVYGAGTASFVVSSSQPQVAATRLVTDRSVYDTAQLVQLSVRVANTTSNTALADVQVRTQVRSGAGSLVLDVTEPLAQLSPGAARAFGYSLPGTSLTPGVHMATLEVLDTQSTILSRSTTTFTVQSGAQSGVGLTGQVQAQPAQPLVGAPVQLSLVVQNATGSDLQGVPVTVRIVDPATQALVATLPAGNIDLAAGQSRTVTATWTVTGADGQTLLVAASATVGTNSVPLGQAPLQVIGQPLLQAIPSTLGFAALNVGESTTHELRMVSAGTRPAQTVTFTITGADASQFALGSAGCAGTSSLPVGATCTLTVTYRPLVSGSHAAAVRVDYAGAAAPLNVPLTAQALTTSFSGSVFVDPAQPSVGAPLQLTYSVSNPSTVTSQLTATLVVRAGTTQVEQWPVQVQLAAGATQGASVPFTPSAAGVYTVLLSQLLPDTTRVLASRTFTVSESLPRVQLTAGLQGKARVLVLMSCPVGESGNDNATCLAQRVAAVSAYLLAQGVPNQVVTNKAAFHEALRCGGFNTYWISGGAQKLDDAVIAELRLAVVRGDALWMDGVHDSRNKSLHDVAGVKHIGKLSQSNQAITYAEGSLYGVGTLATLGQPTRFELADPRAKTQARFASQSVPAIVSNDFGQGRSLLFAFDLAGMLTADPQQSSAPLRQAVVASATHSAAGTHALTVGDYTQVAASVGNQGSATATLRVEGTLPAGVTSTLVTPAPASMARQPDGSHVITWSLDLQGGASRGITLDVRVSQAGLLQIPLEVFALPRPGSSGAPVSVARSTVDMQVANGSALVQAATAAVAALQPTSSSEKNKRTKAVEAVAEATRKHAAAQYAEAISKWAEAADQVAGITSIDTTLARLAIAQAMSASSDASCTGGSGSCRNSDKDKDKNFSGDRDGHGSGCDDDKDDKDRDDEKDKDKDDDKKKNDDKDKGGDRHDD